MPKAPIISLRAGKFIYQFEINPLDWDEHHLRHPVPGFDDDLALSSIPDGDHDLTLIIGVYQTDKIAKHDALFMSESGSGQQYRCDLGIRDMHSDTRRDEVRFAGRNMEMFLQACAQIHSRRTVGGVIGQGKFTSYAFVEDADLDLVSFLDHDSDRLFL